MNVSCLLVILILILTLVYWFLTKTYNHWKRQNIPFLQNALPGFGHMLPVITFKENITEFFTKMYNKSDTSVIGFYFLRRPALFIRDPELVKCILQTNFSNFHNNGIVLNKKSDPVMSKNPFFTDNYESWKEARIRTTRLLANKKIGHLFPVIQDVCCKMNNYFERKLDEKNTFFECELKELSSKYTGEIIANTAFAIEGESFKDNPNPIAFTNVANTIFETTLINGFKQTLIFYMPEIANFLGLSFLQKRTDTYFRETLKAIIERRKQENNAPNDYLQFCINSNSEDDLDSIICDVIVFYLDVYETASTVLSILLYHLSIHPEIQEKLRNHINLILEQTEGVLTYESLKNFNYIEEVLYESIRMLPPIGMFMKVCTQEITLTGNDGLTFTLQPKDPVFISLPGLHLDPKYWDDPHIFNPERFSKENEADKSVFLGFSAGPRICPGIRVQHTLIKSVVISLLTKYSIEYSSKTKTPLKLVTGSFMTYIQGGLWAKFRKLNQTN